MYTVPDQPDIPDKKKKIVKTENVVRTTHMVIEDLLYEHAEICIEYCNCQIAADNIVDELIEINKILPVGNIPEKFKQEKK